MAHEVPKAHPVQHLILPATVTGLTDVTRLQRESETLDEYLRQAALRKGGSSIELPKIPVMLDDVATSNHLNLLQVSDRKKLADFLQQLQTKAPVVHISFASEPSTEFTSKIVTWLRQNIHPMMLVQVGLQPSLAAGCTLRTTNKVFDFSLRQHFVRNRQLLVDALAKLDQAPAAPQPQPAAVSAVPATPAPTGAVRQ
jgi:F0F1-type ATP synthase delta subunit